MNRTQTDVARMSVSVPKAQVEAAKRAVQAGRAPSLSAYVAEAMRDHEQRNELDDLLAAMWEVDGQPTDDERQRVREEMGLA